MTLRTYRYRTRGGGWKYPAAIHTAYNGAGNATTTNVFANGQLEYMSDFVSKGFNKAQERGEVIMNPMTRDIRAKSSVAITYAHVYRNGYPNQWYMYSGGPWTRLTHGYGSATGDLVAKPGSFLASYADVDNLAIEVSTRCLSGIGRASTDTWENMAEANKTLNTLWSPLGSWFQFERKARAASLALSSANAWLMYRYGIRPLVGSINDVMTAVARGMTHERKTTRARGNINLNRERTFTHSTEGVFARVQCTDSESVEVRGMSLDEMTTDWRYQYGFDAKSLMTLPWNLVAYSFVVDWFANVGDLIGALGQAFYPQSLGRCLSTTQVGSTSQRGATEGWVSGYTVVSPGVNLVREDATRKERVTGLRSPGLVVKADFGLSNVTRLGDAVSLVGQQLLSRFLRR